MSEIVIGFWLRFLQCGLEASLTLLVGVFTAGVFRRMVGPAGTRNLFGSGPKGLVRGWLAGMLLPVCSLGVIPVARELRRAGVPGGTVLAFVLAAPLLNPISFLYGLTLAQPSVILTFAGASLVLSTLAGFLWDRVFARDTDAAESARLAAVADVEPLPAQGPRRLLAVLVSAVKDLTGRDLLFYVVGLAGSALLAAAIPFGALSRSMQPHDPLSPLLMAAVGIPIFSSPLSGMMKIGLMFGHGNSIGAAFVLFALGIGTSVGTVVWLVVDFGRRRVLPWLGVYFTVVVGMAYVAQPLLTDPTKKAEDHSHAFDDYCCPFMAGSAGDVGAVFANKLGEKFGPLERPPVYALGGLIVLGLLVRRWDRDGRVERWLTTRDPQTGTARPKWDVAIPGPVLGGLAILGLVAFSVIGAFVYYPDRAQCFEDMKTFNLYADPSSNSAADAVRSLEDLDLASRKLEVGVFLRTWRKTPEQATAGDEYREALERVRDAVREGKADAAKRRYKLRPEERRLHDAVRVGDWTAAMRIVGELDDGRRRLTAEVIAAKIVASLPTITLEGLQKLVAELAATKLPALFSAEIGPLWPAIRAGNAAAATEAMEELGYGEHTAAECYEALKRAFPGE